MAGQEKAAKMRWLWFGFFYLLFAFITMYLFQTISVWPSAGVAVAALLLYGYRMAWLVFVASILVVLVYFASLQQSLWSWPVLVITLLTATGNTLGAAVGLWLCGHVSSMAQSFADLQWVLKRFLPATALCGVVAAVFGVGSYWLISLPWPHGYLNGVVNWSVSNMVGALVVAPLLMCQQLQPGWRRSLRQARLKLLALLCLSVTAFFLFGPGQIWLPPAFLQPALLLIPLLFVTLTASPCVVFLFQVMTFLLVWVGTTAGYGPFISENPTDTETAMQLFCGFLAAVILVIQALLAEQRRLRKIWATELLSSKRLLEQRVEERTRQLSEANRQLELLSVTDALTGLANRRRFDSYLSAEWQRASRLGQKVGLMMLDVDWFKNYNDQYGHLQGDECLRQIGQLLRLGARRATDLAARYGGEEFALVVPQAEVSYLKQQAELMRVAFASLHIPHQGSPLGHVTVSIGIAVLTPMPQQDPELLIQLADEALYRAKHQGRNQVVLADEGQQRSPVQ